MHYIFSKREKAIFYVVISVIFLILSFNFLFSPILNKYNVLNKEIVITRAKLKKYNRLLSQKDLIQDRVKELSFDFKIEDIQGDTPMAAFSILEEVARNSNIQISEIRPQGLARDVSASREFLIDLRAKGTMEGYLKFIYNLENSPFLLKIKKLQITAKQNTPLLEGYFVIAQLSLLE